MLISITTLSAFSLVLLILLLRQRWIIGFFIRELRDILASNQIIFFEVTLPERIGHLAGEIDAWLKESILTGNPARKAVLIVDLQRVANTHFLAYCQPHFSLIINRRAWQRSVKIMPDLDQLVEQRFDYFHGINDSVTCYSIHNRWQGRAPLFELSAGDLAYRVQMLSQWGIGSHDWYVCFHNRERGYSAGDDDLHDYRNAAIQTYLPAMQEVVARGGWVIRMGDPAMTPLPALDRVIDYALSPLRSARLDVVLCASAKFVIGSSSGLFIVSSAFGVPVATTNLAPMSMQAMTPNDIGLPKLYYSEKEGRLLRFAEVLGSPVANFRFTEQFKQEHIRLIENDPDDILAVTQEMLERMSGNCVYSAEDEDLLHRYRSLFKPGHYGVESSARISRAFLRKHRDLLE